MMRQVTQWAQDRTAGDETGDTVGTGQDSG